MPPIPTPVKVLPTLNYAPAELTPAQRAAAIKRRKQIWEALHPQSGNSVPTLGGRGNVGFAADTCAAAGLTKRAINEHLARAGQALV